MHDEHQVQNQDNKEDDNAAGVAVAFGKEQEENPQRTGDHAEEADEVDEDRAIGRWNRQERLWMSEILLSFSHFRNQIACCRFALVAWSSL